MSKYIDILGWLETFYQGECTAELEQDRGFSIQTLDNPGWLVKANLPRRMSQSLAAADRVLSVLGEPPCATNGNIGGDIWMTCEIRSAQFVGAGDPTQLRAILAQLRSLVEDGAR